MAKWTAVLACLLAVGCGGAAPAPVATRAAQDRAPAPTHAVVPAGPAHTYAEYVEQTCSRETDRNACYVRLLDGPRHLSALELSMLVEAHAARGNERLMRLAMERYVVIYPEAEQAERYQEALETETSMMATR
jgi:hypothetical protein